MALSVIEFQDPTGEVIIARIPNEGSSEIIFGSQLIVQDGQQAVFFRDGNPTDVFGPGRYTLSTQNLPVLSKLLKLPTFGGKSPFRAYVYYIHLKTFINLGWGTPTPILFRDEEFKAVHIRAHGSFSLRVSDPNLFLRTIIGSQGIQTTFAIQEYARRIIVPRFANLFPSILTTILDLPSQYKKIEISLKNAVYDDLQQYGLELVDLVVEAISVPPEVQKMIDRAAGSRALDESELHRYKITAMSDALRDSANQPVGNGIAGAMAFGTGLAMAGEMAGSTNKSPASTPPPIPSATSKKQWFAAIAGKQTGPLSREQIKFQIMSGGISKETYVWQEGMAQWVKAGTIPDINSQFSVTPPPPLPDDA